MLGKRTSPGVYDYVIAGRRFTVKKLPDNWVVSEWVNERPTVLDRFSSKKAAVSYLDITFSPKKQTHNNR